MLEFQTTGYPVSPDPTRLGMKKMSGAGGYPNRQTTNPDYWSSIGLPQPGMVGNPPTGGTVSEGSGRPSSGSAAGGYQQPYPGMSPFGPGSNLIGTQINPGASPRTQGAQADADKARGDAAGYQFQPFTAMNPLDDSKSRGAFTGANDLAQQQQGFAYRPVAGTDLSSARQYLATAGANIGPSAAASGLMGPGAMGGFAFGGDTGQVRGQTKAQLDKVLNTTPDRSALASSELQRLIQESDPAFQNDMRNVNKKAAAMGRGGAGITTSDLGDVLQRRNEQIAFRQMELADRVAQQKLQDEQDKLNAAMGVTQGFGGLDLSAGSLNLGYQNANNAERGAAFDRARALGNDTFGRAMDASNQSARFAGIDRGDALTERDAERTAQLDANDVFRSRSDAMRRMGSDLYGLDSDAYGRGRYERDAALDFDQGMFRNRMDLFGALSGEDQRLTQNDRSDRNELRGERDYQYGLSRDAQGDRRQARLDEEDLLNSRFRRGQGLFDAGYSQDPTGIMGGQANSFGQDAASNYGAMGDLFGTWAQRRTMRGRQGPSGPVPQVTIPEFEMPDPRRSGAF